MLHLGNNSTKLTIVCSYGRKNIMSYKDRLELREEAIFNGVSKEKLFNIKNKI